MYKINAKKSVPMPKGCPQNKQTEKRDQTGPKQSRVENLKWTWEGLGPERCQFYGQTRNFHPSLSPANGVGAVLCVYVCV